VAAQQLGPVGDGGGGRDAAACTAAVTAGAAAADTTPAGGGGGSDGAVAIAAWSGCALAVGVRRLSGGFDV